jgi:hypothetical protein
LATQIGKERPCPRPIAGEKSTTRLKTVEPITPELRQHYLARQLEHERRGEWDDANLVNQWLVRAFATVADFMNDNLPLIRRHFLRRLGKAGVI